MQIELIYVSFTKYLAEQKDRRRSKGDGIDAQKELLPSGCCCFACLQEVLMQISQSKTLTKALQNMKCSQWAGSHLRTCG